MFQLRQYGVMILRLAKSYATVVSADERSKQGLLPLAKLVRNFCYFNVGLRQGFIRKSYNRKADKG